MRNTGVVFVKIFSTHKKGITMHHRRFPMKRLITLVCILIGFAMSETFAPISEAAAGGCRADPIVILSDDTILDVTADIGTAVSNVREIHYVIHGPRGVKLVAAISTPTLGFKGKETFTYIGDADPKQYITETLVQTTYNRVSVTAHTTFVNLALNLSDPLALKYNPVKGFNNQILRLVLKR